MGVRSIRCGIDYWTTGMTDYTKLAKEWLDTRGPNWHACHNTHDAVEYFATFLNERASREELPNVPCSCDECKPQEKPVGPTVSTPFFHQKPCEHELGYLEDASGICLCTLCGYTVRLPKPTPSKALEPKASTPPLGWMCPVCFACYAIWVSKCENSHLKVTAGSSTM